MGYYIEVPEHFGKADQLRALYGAEPVESAYPPPEGKTLVCVVDNGWMEAAGVIYDSTEYKAFSDPDDPRPRTWLLLDTDKARDLSGAPV